MKRLVGLFMVFGLLLSVSMSLIAGGGAEAAEPQKPEKLSIIALELDVEQFADGVALFEERYGIEVEWIPLPYGELWPQITTTISGGAPLDLYMMSNSWHPELGRLGMAVAIDEMVTPAELAKMTENYYDITVDFLSSHGHLWGLPGTATLQFLYYNKSMLSELGYSEPPQTFEQMVQISREAIDAGLASVGFHPGWTTTEDGMVWFDLMLKLHGGEWMNEDRTQWVFNNEAGVRTLTYMKELMDEGIVPRAALEVTDWANFQTFLAGDAPFEINWVFVYSTATNPEQSSIVDDLGVALVPGIERESYAVLGGGGYGISPTSRNREWALTLLQYMKGEAGARGTMRTRHGAEAPWQPFFEEPLIHEFPLEQYPLRDVYRQQMEYVGLRPSDYLTWYSDLRDNIMTPAIHRALLGQQGIREALDQAQRQAQQQLDSQGL